MKRKDDKPKPRCSRCGSGEMVMKSRTPVGDSYAGDVIRTEMIGCAIVYRYLACEACGQSMTRAEYENFQKGG